MLKKRLKVRRRLSSGCPHNLRGCMRCGAVLNYMIGSYFFPQDTAPLGARDADTHLVNGHIAVRFFFPLLYAHLSSIQVLWPKQ